MGGRRAVKWIEVLKWKIPEKASSKTPQFAGKLQKVKFFFQILRLFVS
jgi:hypothetical protein